MALAVLVTSGKAAGRTFTVSVKAAESKAAMAAAWVAVTVGPLVETLHPAPAASAAGKLAVTIAPEVAKDHPAPAALTNERPAGSVSRTVMAEAVAAVPGFRTTIV